MRTGKPSAWWPIRLLLSLLAIPLVVFATNAQSKPNPPNDSDCLTCHRQRDLKSESGKSVFVDEAKHKAGVHSVLGCTDCHTDIKEFPHPGKIAKVSCATCHADEAAALPSSVHSPLGEDACATCHGSAHNAMAAAVLTPRLCASCHRDEVKGFLSSVHQQAARRGDSQAPSCLTCHGPVHKMLAARDPNSPVAKKNLPDTCATCHSNAAFLARHQIPFAHPVEAYKMSVHGRAIAAGKLDAATCSDCHGSHEIHRASNPKSKVNHWNVPATCGGCHRDIAKTYAQSVHGQAVARGATDAPVCTDCHGEHVILAPSEPQSLVNPARVSLMTCGRCHGDERIDARYSLPADRVPTFADSYHGLASRAGSQSVANCASCHGIHNIFPSSDPRSTVNQANLSRTCGACHPGAGQRFAIGLVHVRPETQSEQPVVRFIRHIYWVLIPLTIGFMLIHHFLDFLRKLLLKSRTIGPAEAAFRLNPHFRVAHALTLISFPVLVLTGFALKFPETWWARPLLLWEGDFALRGTIHRVAAIVLLSSLGYHLIHLILDRRAALILRHMIPERKDLQDLQDMLAYNLGFSKRRPVLGEFSYAAKLEYLAFLWGTIVMTVTGFALWFTSFTLRYFPKWVLDASVALHYYEAILATFAILIWHMYSVVFDPDIYPMDRVRLRHPALAYAEGMPTTSAGNDKGAKSSAVESPVSESDASHSTTDKPDTERTPNPEE